MADFNSVNAYAPVSEQLPPAAAPVAADGSSSCCLMETIRGCYQTGTLLFNQAWGSETVQSIRANYFGSVSEKILLLAVISLAVSVIFFAIMGLAVIAPFMAFAALEVAKWCAIIGLVGVGVGCVATFGDKALGCLEGWCRELNRPTTPATPPSEASAEVSQ